MAISWLIERFSFNVRARRKQRKEKHVQRVDSEYRENRQYNKGKQFRKRWAKDCFQMIENLSSDVRSGHLAGLEGQEDWVSGTIDKGSELS